MSVDHSAMKLGLLPPKPGLKLPGMERLGVPLPQAAPVIDWGRAMQPTKAWGMDLNDQVSDCTIAAVDHVRRLWHANCQTQYGVAEDGELIMAYSAVSGYDPVTGENDNGALWTDVLARWRTDGFMLGGTIDQTAAFVRLKLGDMNELRLAVQWFGAALVGVALPLAAQQQETWDVVRGPDGERGSWGGHAIPITAYDPDVLTCITWGEPKSLTWRFWRHYASEAYAVLSPDWLEKSGASPAGMTIDALRTDLTEIGDV